jgi:hypothetical protein
MAKTPSRAVVETRAPAEVEADNEQKKLWRRLDFYGTPPWAGRAGAEIIRRLDPTAKTLLEPACGMGTMCEPLREYFDVFNGDIHDYGCNYPTIDFLAPGSYQFADVDWVVTNPPFGLAAEFLARGLEVANKGVALLCRLSFLSTGERYLPLYRSENPMTLCAPIMERVPMVLGPWKPGADTMTEYAWFFFQKGAAPMPVDPVPPGTRDRLYYPDDDRRFCKPAPAPLFDSIPL